MGADNWAICPKCKGKSIEQTKQLKQQIKDSYGKRSEEEYNRMREKLEDLENLKYSELGNTLREDYEIGIWDGAFTVKYYASCSQCSFEYSYQHEDTIKILDVA